MNHLFRLAYLILSSVWRPRISMLDECITNFRTLPTDLDPLMHMNNGVYLSLMDLGRIDLMLRCGAWGQARKNGIYPVVASQTIRYRRSLQLFQPFSIKTKILCWDDRYFFLLQTFISNNEVYAQATVKGRFLKNKGEKVPPKELLALIGINLPSPQIPKNIQLWTESERV